MKNDKYFALIILFIFCCLLVSCAEKEFSQNETVSLANATQQPRTISTPDLLIPDGWILIPRPKENSREVRCAGSRRDWQWRVETEAEKIKISKYDEYAIDEQINKLPPDLQDTVLQTRDIGNGTAYFHIEPYEGGWLAGLDAGEWGGRLTWFSSDGKQKIVILRNNILGIAKVGNEVLILHSESVMLNEGEVSKLTRNESGSFQLQPLVNLGYEPISFVIESDNSMLISLVKKIVRVKTSGEMETWREIPFNGLSVTMARTNSGVVYSGMFLFVVRFIPTSDGIQEQWFMPRGCRRFILKNDDCICESEK